MNFWLGTHREYWLEWTDVPLFVSHRRLNGRHRLPVARGPWALDSGGFTELGMFGEWRTTETEYATAIRRYISEVGGLAWVAPQDWMCEPIMLAKTGKTIAEHQSLTVRSFLSLRERGLPVIPVVQGWDINDYMACVGLYAAEGVDLEQERLVGVGSVCRRQATDEIGTIMSELASLGLRLHGFGVKIRGLARYAGCLASADSMAWSFDARRRPALPGCEHNSCQNCLQFALWWRLERVLPLLEPKP